MSLVTCCDDWSFYSFLFWFMRLFRSCSLQSLIHFQHSIICEPCGLTAVFLMNMIWMTNLRPYGVFFKTLLVWRSLVCTLAWYVLLSYVSLLVSHDLLRYLTWVLYFPKFMSSPDCEWEIGKKSITLQCQSRKTLQCRQLKLIEVFYEHDHDHQLIELLWWLGRSIPDANIKLAMVTD